MTSQELLNSGLLPLPQWAWSIRNTSSVIVEDCVYSAGFTFVCDGEEALGDGGFNQNPQNVNAVILICTVVFNNEGALNEVTSCYNNENSHATVPVTLN